MVSSVVEAVDVSPVSAADQRDASAQERFGKARQLYKAASDAGLTTRYFQQTEQGGWKEAG